MIGAGRLLGDDCPSALSSVGVGRYGTVDRTWLHPFDSRFGVNLAFR
ncbi:hypothetical protein RHOER0001_6587 [Rhodococcus erythropolis SK121]|nr:hypothetical protein RHOER0001_6587 [Rhodococcus erythropolis SK121]